MVRRLRAAHGGVQREALAGRARCRSSATACSSSGSSPASPAARSRFPRPTPRPPVRARSRARRRLPGRAGQKLPGKFDRKCAAARVWRAPFRARSPRGSLSRASLGPRAVATHTQIRLLSFQRRDDALPRPRLRLRRHARPRRAVSDRATIDALERLRAIGPAARAGHRPRAGRPADASSRASTLFDRDRGRERRAALPARRRARSGCSPSRRPRRSSPRCARAASRRCRSGAVDRRDLGAARDGRARGDPRPRARAAGDLQQGRGDGAAVRRQQGDRPARGARGAGPVAAQRRRHRRRRERPRVPRRCASARSRSPTRCPR